MKKLASATAIALLAGCASTPTVDYDRAFALIDSGRCDEAYALLKLDQDPGNRNNNFGVLAFNCYKNEKFAFEYFTVAAQFGSEKAVQNLQRRGWPVPQAVYAARPAQSPPTSSSAGDAAALSLILLGAIVDGKNKANTSNAVPLPTYTKPTVTCKTRSDSLSPGASTSLTTTCQ